MPGISASSALLGATTISQVLVPMILTRTPLLMPEPTAPKWASNAPIATGIPAFSPSLPAHSPVSRPAA